MSELIIVDYHDADRAGEVLDALKQEHPEWRDNLGDAAVFIKQADETVRVPTTAAPAAAGTPLSAEQWQEQMGLSDAVMVQVQRLVRPGDSALLMRIRAGDPDQVMDAMQQQYGGRMLHASLTSRQDEPFQSGSASESESWA